jgi:uncharacterized membrane protein
MVSQRTSIGRAISAGNLAAGGAQAYGVNVGPNERLLSLAGGGLLAWLGMREGGLGGAAVAVAGGALVYRGLTGHCPVYAATGVNTAERHARQASVAAGRGFKVVQAVAVDRDAEELFNIWRDFENLPRFMSHLLRVEARGNRSHWVAHGPAGTQVAWDAEIINEDPGRMIAWRSLEGSTVSTAGSVHFTVLPAGRGTEVLVSLKYDPPGGPLGSWLAWLFGQDPNHQVREDLRRFKQLAEAGEIARAESRPVRRF